MKKTLPIFNVLNKKINAILRIENFANFGSSLENREFFNRQIFQGLRVSF